MKHEVFEQIVKRQMDLCETVLLNKAEEYATEDRLHNFKIAAELSGISLKQALGGMMAKHTVSIYDMCWSEDEFSPEKWDEKITDHLNYLFILKAVLVEESQEPKKTTLKSSTHPDVNVDVLSEF